MLGTLVNTLTIIVGSTFGHFVKKGIKKEYQKVMFTAMGLASLALGFNAVSNHLPKSQYPVLFIISLSIGGLIGTVIDIDGRFKRLVSRFSSSNSNLAQGLSTGILLYCIGTLSIVGPMLSALYNDNTYLFTNATLDLVTSAVLAATYGIGMKCNPRRFDDRGFYCRGNLDCRFRIRNFRDKRLQDAEPVALFSYPRFLLHCKVFYFWSII